MPDFVRASTPIAFPDFRTHLNYLDFMADISQGLSISPCRQSYQPIPQSSQVNKKLTLIRLTHQNLQAEKAQIVTLPEYAIICASWEPVKAYYLIFNLLLLLEYLISGNDEWFSKRHCDVLRYFTDLIRTRQIVFSEPQFNSIHSPATVDSWHIPAGQNVTYSVADPIRHQEICRKLYCYYREDFRRNNNNKPIAGVKRTLFLSRTTVKLFDFFYLYRIKANYRDMEFIDEQVPMGDFVELYSNYYQLTMNFYEALTVFINQLAQMRLGRALFV